MSQSDNQSTMAQVTRRQLREQEQCIRRAFVRMARMRAESERLQRRLAALEFRVVEGDKVRLTELPYKGRAARVVRVKFPVDADVPTLVVMVEDGRLLTLNRPGQWRVERD